MPASQYKEQSGHCILEEISHSSKNSVLPMLVINSFDFSLDGLNSSVLLKSSINESRFGWFSNYWINLLRISLRFVSSFWTVEWGNLEFWIKITATSFLVPRATSLLVLRASFALRVGGCSHFGINKSKFLEETDRQQRCARGKTWNLAKNIYKLTRQGYIPHTLGRMGTAGCFNKRDWRKRVCGRFRNEYATGQQARP